MVHNLVGNSIYWLSTLPEGKERAILIETRRTPEGKVEIDVSDRGPGVREESQNSMPPVTKHVTAADVLRDPQDGWWVVLTPACDLYGDLPSGGNRAAKAEYVRIAKAVPLSEAPLIARWIEAGSPGNESRERNAALEMFRDNNARYRILPKYLDIPDLLVDFEIVQSVPLAEVRSWT
ncbi:ATP-binding protein [Streptomyces sp. NPDC028635]|uniref:ATP-binding protein n=1 Tax=Streptomyces sp. NPDC028635 TaxID=3154800 RepID=UPI0033EBD8D7